MLFRRTAVERVATLLEIADHPLTVFDRVVVVVLGLFTATANRSPRMPQSIHPGLGLQHDKGGVPALGLEVAQLGGQDLDLAFGIIDDRLGTADELQGAE